MVFAPFFFIYLLICLGLVIGLLLLLQMQLISSAFLILGLSPRLAILALLRSLIGSYVNIPLYTVESGPAPDSATADNFGLAYTIPFEYGVPRTTVAINIGGALVPLVVSGYALLKAPAAFLPSALATTIVAIVTHLFARPLRGLGIALPMFIPPLIAAVAALFLGRVMRVARSTHVIAYVSGVVGTLIGADLTNLHRIADLGAPVASIGGAGTFDGVFLTGIVAVLLARYCRY
jgi:uncharacterized membrane protein